MGWFSKTVKKLGWDEFFGGASDLPHGHPFVSIFHRRGSHFWVDFIPFFGFKTVCFSIKYFEFYRFYLQGISLKSENIWIFARQKPNIWNYKWNFGASLENSNIKGLKTCKHCWKNVVWQTTTSIRRLKGLWRTWVGVGGRRSKGGHNVAPQPTKNDGLRH